MSIAQDAAAPIERYGHKWRVPTFADLAALQTKVDLPKQWQPFISVTDMCRWCTSPAGIVAFLAQVGGLKPSAVREKARERDLAILANELIDQAIGDSAEESSEPADPLVTTETASDSPLPLHVESSV